MTNIALLTADISDDYTAQLLRGARQKAREAGVQLSVYCGRFLVSPGHKETEHPDYYQEQAVFEYIGKSNTAACIIDAKAICRHASLRKRRAFLERFAALPMCTLEEVAGEEQPEPFLLGERALMHALSLAGVEAAPAKAAKKKEEKEETAEPFPVLTQAAHALLQRDYPEDLVNPYDMLMEQVRRLGIRHAAIFLYPEVQVNTRKAPFVPPETFLLLSMVRDKKTVSLREAQQVRTQEAVSHVAKEAPDACAFIVSSLFLGDRQVGLLVTELSENLLVPYVHALLVHILAGAIRLIAGDMQILQAQDSLRAHQAALDKDASVLERLGDEDYLTKRLNRRGFFSQAYDLLEKNFREGTHAIVAYIDMDSIKSINEYFGREEGDYAVRFVADMLEGIFGKDSILGRIRGNEFAVLLVTDDAGEADRLRDEMTRQNTRLVADTHKPYVIHLQYSVCDFAYSEGLSLKQMLAETDENLQRIRQM